MTKINGLNQQVRSPNSPSPIYGDGSLRMNTLAVNKGLLRPGFNIGDLDRQFASPIYVYGTWTYPLNSTNFPPGTYSPLLTQIAIADAIGTIISPNARAVKIIIHVSGPGTTRITAQSSADTYTATIFDTGVLTAGDYDFYLGGWSSPSSDTTNRTYQATRYGPPKPGTAVTSTDPTGDEETVNPNPAADSNYVGGTYNPIEFISLDGQSLKFFSILGGTAAWDVSVIPLS
jgi:hypothetical protein